MSMPRAVADYFSVVLEAAPVGMLVVDASGVILLVNRHMEQLFGYERSELLGSPLERLLPERMRGRHVQLRGNFMTEPSARPMGAGRDLFGLHKNGLEVPVEIGLSPVTIENAQYVLSSVVDITERRRSEERFRLALEASPTGMILVDDEGRITLVNAQVETLFGYEREELIGRKIEMLLPEGTRASHPALRAAFGRAPSTRPMGEGRELHAIRKDGSEISIEIGLNPLQLSTGSFVLSSIVDVSERDRSIRQLREQSATLAATVKEREVMLQEIHHRVKNNLQIITSLINMQIRRLGPGQSLDALSECKTRVDAIALIHEKLYQSNNFASIPFASYARGLVAHVRRAAGHDLDRIVTEQNIDEIALPVSQAISCGLIVNELFTNAIKHAFPEQCAGWIRVSLKQVDPATLRLMVADNGVGMPPFDAAARRDSIGLSLVASLADQLGGRLHIATTDGVAVTVDFPA